MPIAIYTRGGADRLDELRDYARKRYAGQKTLEYVDTWTGPLLDSPTLRRLRDDVRDGRVVGVVSFDVDEMTRGVIDAVEVVTSLIDKSVDVVIPGEGGELWRSRSARFLELTKPRRTVRGAGGRPKVTHDPALVAKIKKLRLGGSTFEDIVSALGDQYSRATVHRIWQRHKDETPPPGPKKKKRS